MLTVDIKKLVGVNPKIDNIYRISPPYWLRSVGGNKSLNGSGEQKMVVFFGNDITSNMVLNIDDDRYTVKTNECLDYIRREFKGYDLCYKPHPAEDKEIALLNLDGFRIVREKMTAELFLWEDSDGIRAVFSLSSSSSASAYRMGLNSYSFYKCCSGIFPPERMRDIAALYAEMPESFFISDLAHEPVANERILKKDELLESNLKKALAQDSGKVWFVCSFAGSIDMLVILSELIKNLVPDRQRGLIINKSHRWETLDTNYLKDYFDEIVFFPRVFYSLKPVRLWRAVKIARKIRNFKIAPHDILIAATFPEFIEDCFMSYHKKNLKIGFIANIYFNLQYNIRETAMDRYNDFRFNKATWFYNRIFEPLLGLYRTIYAAYSEKKGYYTNRYQRPINEVFDQLYIMEVNK